MHAYQPLGGPGAYVHWGVVQLSVANLVVIAVMLLLLVAAIALPFPSGRDRGGERHG